MDLLKRGGPQDTRPLGGGVLPPGMMMMTMKIMMMIYNDGVYLCPCVCNEKVTTSWIVNDDNIYIMMANWFYWNNPP